MVMVVVVLVVTGFYPPPLWVFVVEGRGSSSGVGGVGGG